jgi:hypothetical protein
LKVVYRADRTENTQVAVFGLNFRRAPSHDQVLALRFLLLIGVNLVAEGVGFHIPKGYTYFAMAFVVFVEMLNLKIREQPKPRPRGRSPSLA